MQRQTPVALTEPSTLPAFRRVAREAAAEHQVCPALVVDPRTLPAAAVDPRIRPPVGRLARPVVGWLARRAVSVAAIPLVARVVRQAPVVPTVDSTLPSLQAAARRVGPAAGQTRPTLAASWICPTLLRAPAGLWGWIRPARIRRTRTDGRMRLPMSVWQPRPAWRAAWMSA